MANDDKLTITLIKVQIGSYLSKYDIILYEDVYASIIESM